MATIGLVFGLILHLNKFRDISLWILDCTMTTYQNNQRERAYVEYQEEMNNLLLGSYSHGS